MLPLRCVWQRYCRASLTVLWELLRDGLQFLNVAARSRTALAAEVLFLRKQLAYYRDHQIRPRRLTDAARLSLVLWSRLFDWKEALMVVTRDLCALASQGFQAVLALEVTRRTAGASQKSKGMKSLGLNAQWMPSR